MLFEVTCSPEHIVPPACVGPNCSTCSASPDNSVDAKQGFVGPWYLGQTISPHLEPYRQVCPACWSARVQQPRSDCIQSRSP